MKTFYLAALLLWALPPATKAQTHVSFATSLTDNGSSNIKAVEIPLSEINQHIGKHVTVQGTVFSARLLKNVVGSPTLLNLGGDEPNERVELRILFKDLEKFNGDPEKIFLHKQVRITGLLTNPHKFPEITISAYEQEKLIQAALQSIKEKSKQLRIQPLAANAYLLVGPNLSEAIITHLRAGSKINLIYKTTRWAYVSVVEKNGTNLVSNNLCGFVRAQAVGKTRLLMAKR